MARILFWSLVVIAAALPVGGVVYWAWATLRRVVAGDSRHVNPGIVLWTTLMLGALVAAVGALFGLVALVQGWVSIDCGERSC